MRWFSDFPSILLSDVFQRYVDCNPVICKCLSVAVNHLMMYLFSVFRNPNEPQDEKLRLSKERNRFKSVNWEFYDKKQRKYLEIGNLFFLFATMEDIEKCMNLLINKNLNETLARVLLVVVRAKSSMCI